VVNKTDCFPMFDFDLDVFRERVRKLNPGAEIFPLSCKTGEGMDRWIAWLEKAIAESRSR